MNMKRRLADIGGTCEIESRPGSGTAVQLRLRLPAGKANEPPKPAAAKTLLLCKKSWP
jgi:signal transduction histidine kinase